MRRLWLVIFCVAALHSAAYVQNDVVRESRTETKFIRNEEDGSITIWMMKPNVLHEDLLSLGEQRTNVRFALFPTSVTLTDADVEALCSLPNIRGVTVDGQTSDATIMKLERIKNLSELTFRCNISTITGTGLEALGTFKKLEKLRIYGNFSGDDLANLGKLDQLRELDLILQMPIVSGKELAFLEKMTKLRKLQLSLSSHVVADTGLVPSQFTDDALSQLRNLNELEELVISCNLISGKSLSHLSHLKQLRRLDIRNPRLTTEDISHLMDFQQLTSLTINSKALDDTTLAYLGNLTNLRKLEFTAASNITDAGLSHLQSLHNLEDITLTSNLLTGEGLSHLSNLKSLKKLVFVSHGFNFTVSGISRIKNLQQLTECRIEGAVTNEMLRSFEGNETLVTLLIRGNAVTDAGMEHLKTVRNLQNLDISKTGVTQRGVDGLQQALPDCQIKANYNYLK